MKKLTKTQLRDVRAIAAQRDEEIDFSDIPPVLDWSGAEMGKFYRPPKKPVTLRLDADVVEWLKSGGPGYQTRANGLLRHAMRHYNRTGNQNQRTRARKRQRVTRKKRAA
jgi:uncharacterized protein (DUF4415 family)